MPQINRELPLSGHSHITLALVPHPSILLGSRVLGMNGKEDMLTWLKISQVTIVYKMVILSQKEINFLNQLSLSRK